MKEVSMPSDRKSQEVRREAIREILKGNARVEDQKGLVELLRERGIAATQSSVSRDLQELGAVRAKGHYEIPSWAEEDEEEAPFRKVLGFIRRVKPAGPFQTLLVTDPGAAGVVAQAIDASEWEDIVGTLAGDNSVLVLTENSFFQRMLFDRIKYYAGDEYEIIEGKVL
jgi:transcriptional regulator of arginine metabolism